MSTSKTVVVTIGRSIKNATMNDDTWLAFNVEVMEVLFGSELEIVSCPAFSEGHPVSGQVGIWGGEEEDSAVYIATGELSDYGQRAMVLELNLLRERYKQDAIGFIVVDSNEALITGV